MSSSLAKAADPGPVADAAAPTAELQQAEGEVFVAAKSSSKQEEISEQEMAASAIAELGFCGNSNSRDDLDNEDLSVDGGAEEAIVAAEEHDKKDGDDNDGRLGDERDINLVGLTISSTVHRNDGKNGKKATIHADDTHDNNNIPVNTSEVTEAGMEHEAGNRPRNNRASWTDFGGYLMESFHKVGRGGRNTRKHRPHRRNEKKNAVYVIPPTVAVTTAAAGAAVTTATGAKDRTKSASNTTQVETLSSNRLESVPYHAASASSPKGVLKNGSNNNNNNNKYSANPASSDSAQTDYRESTVRFAVPENALSGEASLSSSFCATTSTLPKPGSLQDFPSTMALPPAIRIKDRDDDYAVKVQENLNDAAMAKQLERRQRQQPQNMREASQQFARSVRVSIKAINLENMHRVSLVAKRKLAQSYREMKEIDKKKPWRPHVRRIICLTIIGGIVIGCLFWFAVLGNDVPDPIKDAFKRFISPEQYAENDPFFDKKDPSEADRWFTTGTGGLQIEVINALEEKWNIHFDQAIKDWDNGYPDSLTITTSQAERDVNCTPVELKVKVCNGDYGETGWRGLNNLFLTNGYITASVARMNEFYTGNAATDADEMQYVMCHELGHAWGVLHTDETFGNPDLGNCMDYTNNQRANKQPDQSNFEFLFAIYGLVPGAKPYTAPPSISPPTAAPSPSPASNGDGGDTTNNNNNRRVLERSFTELVAGTGMVHHSNRNTELDTHESVLAAMEAVYNFATGERLQPSKWRLLHQNEYSERHEIDLSSKHKLQVYKLLASSYY